MALGGIGMALFNQRLDHRDHLGNIPRRAGHGIWLKRADSGHIFKIPANRLFGDLANRAACICGLRVDLVVHIREIAHIGHVLGPIDMAQKPIKHIKHNHRTRIADMGTVIDCWPTDIHAHILRADRLKSLLLARLRVV